jgi:thiol-disulfide isomerase/thioredoxin
MTIVARLGLALVRPRAALAVAGGRDHAGRSGTDLLLAIVLLVLATQLRTFVQAIWLGAAVEPVLGIRATVQILTDVLAIPLGILVLGALAIWAAAGPRRDLGRASDLACVAVLPLIVIDLIATTFVVALELQVTRAMMSALSLVAYGWTAALLALAAVEARRPSPSAVTAGRLAKPAGWVLVAFVAAGLAVQAVWIARNFDHVRPVVAGDPAPEFALPRIESQGAAGERVSLASLRGRIVVLDFWATWCQPCLHALPRLQAFQDRHPDIAVVTINIDDPAEARALYDERRYTLTLLAGDAQTSDRYDVSAIPHTVLIDRDGLVRKVMRGGKLDLEREIAGLQ